MLFKKKLRLFFKMHLDTYLIASQSFEQYYHIDGAQLERHYKEQLSGFNEWEQRTHVETWLIFPENIGKQLSIDETSISNGELYTIVTNKAAKGRKGTLIAIIEGTSSEKGIRVLEKIPKENLEDVEEITLDMSESMRKIVCHCFPFTHHVTDCFHIQKLVIDALQEMRISHRWDAINRN